MNGLKFIRKQCNFSLRGLADYIGVSRQIISSWENGTKDIPVKRKKQLSQFFGLDEAFFGEITEDEKQVLLDKAMFSYKNGVENAYRYIPENEGERQIVHFIKERQFTIDEELAINTKNNKELIDSIQQNMSCSMNCSILDELSASYRTRYVFNNIVDSYNKCFVQKSTDKMAYWRVLALVSEAIKLAFTNEIMEERFDGIYRTGEDDSFVEELATIIRKKISKQIEMIPDTTSKKKIMIDSAGKKDERSFKEKVEDAEKQYQEFKKEEIDAREFHVII